MVAPVKILDFIKCNDFYPFYIKITWPKSPFLPKSHKKSYYFPSPVIFLFFLFYVVNYKEWICNVTQIPHHLLLFSISFNILGMFFTLLSCDYFLVIEKEWWCTFWYIFLNWWSWFWVGVKLRCYFCFVVGCSKSWVELIYSFLNLGI